jgi:Subtilase family/Ricin-type beta-trefoil lectin domain-like
MMFNLLDTQTWLMLDMPAKCLEQLNNQRVRICSLSICDTVAHLEIPINFLLRSTHMFRRFRKLAILGIITLAGCGNLNQVMIVSTSTDTAKPEGYLVTLNVTDGSDQLTLEKRYGGTTLVFDASSGFAILHTKKSPFKNDPAVKTIQKNTEVLTPDPPSAINLRGASSSATGLSTWGSGWSSWGSGWSSWGSGWSSWGSGNASWSSNAALPALPSENQATWNQIKLYEAHRLSRNFGGGIKVAVIDSGIDLNHPVFTGKLSSSNEYWDFVGKDATPQDEAGGNGYGHGTAVAGIILQVAPRATILPIRVLRPDGSANTADVVQAISRAVNYNANIINLSLGTGGYDQSLMDICAWANSKGVRIIAAAGNNGQLNNMDSPAQFSWSGGTYSMTIGVGSVNANDQRSSFSSYGDSMYGFAPGENIWSAYPGNKSANFTGTSFAAPIFAGALALGLSETPANQRSNQNLNNAMWSMDWGTATYTTTGGNTLGGRLNVEKFVRNLPGWTVPTDLQAGVYQVANVNSGKCLDVANVSTANNATIQQWTCGTGDNQKWRIEPVGAGLYKLTALHSGRIMGVAASGTADGTKVVQWDYVGVADQKWYIQASGSGYRIVASHSNKCLDIWNFSTADGIQLQQWTCAGNTAQQFKLKALF